MKTPACPPEDFIALVRWDGPPDHRVFFVRTEGPVNLGIATVAICKNIIATPELHASHAAAQALAVSLMGGRDVSMPTILVRNDIPPKGPKS